MKHRIFFSTLVAITLGIWALDAHGYYRTAGAYNSYTGRSASASRSYNPYTGSGTASRSVSNPYTGRSATATRSYNPYTNTASRSASASNPYTGRSASTTGYYHR